LLYKKYILNKKLENLSQNVATQFGKLFGSGLLPEINNYLQTKVRESVTTDKVQFNMLLRENTNLKQQVIQLSGNADLLRETVRVNDIIIAELREENCRNVI
jgi:hypothetical protein